MAEEAAARAQKPMNSTLNELVVVLSQRDLYG